MRNWNSVVRSETFQENSYRERVSSASGIETEKRDGCQAGSRAWFNASCNSKVAWCVDVRYRCNAEKCWRKLNGINVVPEFPGFYSLWPQAVTVEEDTSQFPLPNRLLLLLMPVNLIASPFVMRSCSRVDSTICNESSGKEAITIFSRSTFFSRRCSCQRTQENFQPDVSLRGIRGKPKAQPLTPISRPNTRIKLVNFLLR